MFLAGEKEISTVVVSLKIFSDENGGAVQLSTRLEAKAVYFRNSNFISNTAIVDGGAVSMYGHTQATFVNCTFTANHARQGGAILTTGNFGFSFVSCKFRFNIDRKKKLKKKKIEKKKIKKQKLKRNQCH